MPTRGLDSPKSVERVPTPTRLGLYSEPSRVGSQKGLAPYLDCANTKVTLLYEGATNFNKFSYLEAERFFAHAT